MDTPMDGKLGGAKANPYNFRRAWLRDLPSRRAPPSLVPSERVGSGYETTPLQSFRQRKSHVNLFAE